MSQLERIVSLNNDEINEIISLFPNDLRSAKLLLIFLALKESGNLENKYARLSLELEHKINEFVSTLNTNAEIEKNIRENPQKDVFTPTSREELKNAIILYGSLSKPNLSQEEIIKKAEMGNIEEWNVEHITDMEGVFEKSSLDVNLNNWNTSNVTSMKNMFASAKNFNNGGNPLTFNTSKVKTMDGMFSNAEKFNQSINALDTSGVTNMSNMFFDAKSYDNGGQPLVISFKSIDGNKVINMFFRANNFNNGGQILTITGMKKTLEYVFSQSLSLTKYGRKEITYL